MSKSGNQRDEELREAPDDSRCQKLWQSQRRLLLHVGRKGEAGRTAKDCGSDEGNDEYYGLVRSHINQYVKVEGRI